MLGERILQNRPAGDGREGPPSALSNRPCCRPLPGHPEERGWLGRDFPRGAAPFQADKPARTRRDSSFFRVPTRDAAGTLSRGAEKVISVRRRGRRRYPVLGPPQPALPVAPQLSLGWSWGAGERSHKWFLPAAEESHPRREAAGGRAGCRGWQEKEAGLPGVGAPSSPCRCGGEGSGASWCRWQARREAVLVSLSPSAFASA